MIKSIFGLTSNDVSDFRRKQNTGIQKHLASQTNADPSVAAIGGAFGPKVGRAIAKRLGYEDKLDVQARETAEADEKLKVELSKHELGSSDYFTVLASASASVGDYEAVASWLSKANASSVRNATAKTALEEDAPEVLKAPTGNEFNLAYDLVEKADLGFEVESAEKSSYATVLSQKLQQLKLDYESKATASDESLPTDDIIIADIIAADVESGRLEKGVADSREFEVFNWNTWFDQPTFSKYK